MMRSHSFRNRGFTLIEMMVVLILLGIIAAMAVPGFLRAIRRYEVRTTAQRLADFINFSRVEATRQGKTVYVYPSYFRTDGKVLGAAASWRQANGLLAFADNLSRGFDGMGHYEAGEEVKSIQIKHTLEVIPTFFSPNFPLFFPAELGSIVYPTGEMKISFNYHAFSMGNSGYGMRIVVRNRKKHNICHALWIDNLARAHTCPVSLSGKDVPNMVKQICSCSGKGN